MQQFLMQRQCEFVEQRRVDKEESYVLKYVGDG